MMSGSRGSGDGRAGPGSAVILDQAADQAQQLLLLGPKAARSEECAQLRIGDVAARGQVGLVPDEDPARFGVPGKAPAVTILARVAAAALVWSKAPVIIGAHDTGPLIRSKNGFWLAIPTAAAGRGFRGGKITPREWERRRGLRLRFVYRRRGPSLLVADAARMNTRGQAVASRSKTGRGQATVPIFLLVPQVKLPKRLDLNRDAGRALGSVPGLVVANWVDGRFGA